MAEAFGRRRRKFQRLGSFTPKKSNSTTEKSKKKKKRKKKKNLHNNRTKPEASPVSPVSSEPRPSQPPTTTTCLSLKTSMSRSYGEIVEVEGGHIVRSTGRKDRHSKVCTAKGPRDRRVRLSAHTAIQFYDVQDRLGYDRPSKAVDWLINNAKAAIDQLHQPPPPSLDSDAIKSFFPVVSGEQQSQSQSQDLRLSLQSLQDPIFHQQQQQSFGWSDHHNNNSQSFVFGSPQTAEYGRENSQLLFSSSSSQRGPLQSSNTPNWIDSHHHQSLSVADHHIPHPIHHHHQVAASSSSSMPAGIGIGMGFAAGASTTTSRRGSRARRSTTAAPTSRPLLPPTLAIDDHRSETW